MGVFRKPQDVTFVQSRAEIVEAKIDEYAQMMVDGIEFDPAKGVEDQAGHIYVYDGYHRGQAARRAGHLLHIELIDGTRADAEWLALAANTKHGLQRTQADKRKVVREALLHPNGAKMSNREIARHCGVSDKTVAGIREDMEAAGEIEAITTRQVTRGGQTYEVDTTAIGQQPAEPADGVVGVDSGTYYIKIAGEQVGGPYYDYEQAERLYGEAVARKAQGLDPRILPEEEEDGEEEWLEPAGEDESTADELYKRTAERQRQAAPTPPPAPKAPAPAPSAAKAAPPPPPPAKPKPEKGTVALSITLKPEAGCLIDLWFVRGGPSIAHTETVEFADLVGAIDRIIAEHVPEEFKILMLNGKEPNSDDDL